MTHRELTDDDLEAVVAGKATPQLFGRMASTRPFRPLLGWDFWRARFVAK